MTDDTWRGSYVTLSCGGLCGTPSHRLGLSPAATGGRRGPGGGNRSRS
jgi:hypothetical protein